MGNLKQAALATLVTGGLVLSTGLLGTPAFADSASITPNTQTAALVTGYATWTVSGSGVGSYNPVLYYGDGNHHDFGSHNGSLPATAWTWGFGPLCSLTIYTQTFDAWTATAHSTTTVPANDPCE